MQFLEDLEPLGVEYERDYDPDDEEDDRCDGCQACPCGCGEDWHDCNESDCCRGEECGCDEW